MVAKNELANAGALAQEYQLIEQAVRILDHGGRIVSMTIGSPTSHESGPPMRDVLLRTDAIEYPPQMLNGIKQQLTARQGVITDELRKLGVTVAA